MIMLMNPIKTTLAVALLTLPLAAQAQKHIKKAFDALIDDRQVELSSTHKMEKDPETGEKESQLDWWEFTLPKSKQQLVKDIERAFEKDRDKAYSVSTGHNSPGGEGVESLAVGNSNKNGYIVGEIAGSDYVYALFIDPDDAQHIHRYAYVLEWKDNGQNIIGRLAITYATTLKYRQGNGNVQQNRTVTITTNGNRQSFTSPPAALGNFFSFGDDGDDGDADDDGDDDTWLAKFNTFAQLFRNNPNSTASTYFANYIYNLCKKPQNGQLTAGEKEMVCAELDQLSQLTDNEFTRNIFKNAKTLIKP